MATRTKITSKGIEQKPGNGFDVADHDENVGFAPFKLKTTTTGSVYDATRPGFYYVSGSTLCTGSVANPSDVPGAHLHICMTNANSTLLTGSARASGTTGVFLSNTHDVSGSITVSDKLTIPGFGSVSLVSSGRYWQPYCASGSLVFA